VFKELFGVSITRGGSAQAVLRAGRRCQSVYGQIAHAVRGSPWAVPDETGWRVGGRPAWLHTVVGQHAICFVIAVGRSAEATANILGWDWPGLLIHDGWSSYNRFREAWHQQCVQHLMRRVRKLLETATGGAVRFPRQVLALFEQALALRGLHEEGKLTEDDLAEHYLGLCLRLQELTDPPKRNKANATLAKHLANHIWQWFWFLLEPGRDATNYRAEQALRGGVVNRKVWGGNRTWPGGAAQAILTSVFATCLLGHLQPVDYLSQLLCGAPPPLLPEADEPSAPAPSPKPILGPAS
jgi:transposase